jgi:signal peptidase I
VNDAAQTRATRTDANTASGRRRLKRARRDAGDFIKEVRKLLARHGSKVAKGQREKIEAGLSTLERASTGNDGDHILEIARSLNQLVDKHLGFARKSTFREYVESIGLAVLIALLLRAFVIEAFKIPSGSMIPTLRVGDHIFVNKFSYGLRLPFTKWWFWERDPPQRGEVVVFMFPEDESKDFIKRIVAVPGDTLRLQGHKLIVHDAQGNLVQLDRQVLPDPFRYIDNDPGGGGEVEAVAVREHLGEAEYTVLFRPDSPRGEFGPVKVQPGHVFVLGDNRDNSHDARYWGSSGDGSVQVPIGNIKGRAMFIWWSSFDMSRISDGIE